MAIGRIPEPGTGIPESIVDAKGDLVTATAADTPARLAVGTNEHRLVAASGETTGLKYVADTTNYAIAAKGDLLVGTAADTLQALTVGTNGHTLVADSTTSTGLKWAAASGGGKVLQVVNASRSEQVTTATSTWTDIGTGMSATITPSSASSKIFILISVCGAEKKGNSGAGLGLRLLRDATLIQNIEENAGYQAANDNQIGMCGGFCLDSPNTTSAITYKIQQNNYGGANGDSRTQSALSNFKATSSITLFEIGA